MSTTSHARARAGSPLGGARKYLACLVAVAALFATFSAVSQSQPTASAAKVLASKARCDRNSKAGTINFVSPFAFDASAGIMDVFMAQKLGYFDNLCLKVKINAASFTGEQLVSSGRAQVTGIGSAADHILSVASGANLEAVATYGATDPHAILTNSKITSLKQLEGGTLGYYTNMNPGSLAMLAAAHVDVSKIKLIKLTNFDPTVVTRGQVDGLVGYSSNQGTTLKAAGQPYHAFYPRQFGVKGTYNIMQFNKAWLAKHRDVAADFMRADLKALAYCLHAEGGVRELHLRPGQEGQPGSRVLAGSPAGGLERRVQVHHQRSAAARRADGEGVGDGLRAHPEVRAPGRTHGLQQGPAARVAPRYEARRGPLSREDADLARQLARTP